MSKCKGNCHECTDRDNKSLKDGNLVTRKGGLIFIDVSKNVLGSGDNDKREKVAEKVNG